MERREPRKFLNSRYWSCRMLFHFVVIAGLCAIVVKAFRLQVIEHSFWVGRANACLNTKFTVPAYRGTIYDRQGRVLSYSVPQRSLYAFGGQIENPAETAALLSRILDEPAGSIEKKLTSSSHFVWIKRHLTDQQAIEIEKLKVPGLNLTDEYKRFYPYRQVGGQVVGFVNIDGVGIEGIEKSFDDVLRGKPIPVCQLRDGGRKRLWLNSSAPPEPAESCGVKLTSGHLHRIHCRVRTGEGGAEIQGQSGGSGGHGRRDSRSARHGKLALFRSEHHSGKKGPQRGAWAQPRHFGRLRAGIDL